MTRSRHGECSLGDAAHRLIGKVCRPKDPEKTRQALLEAAHEEIHRQGYQAASLSAILKRAGVTKGALYHHFPNKKALGLAMIDELIAGRIMTEFLKPLLDGEDVLARLKTAFMEEIPQNTQMAELGCPLNNLSQEMSPIDEDFRIALDKQFSRLREGIAEALRRGQTLGKVHKEIDPWGSAVFIIASYEGCLGMAKSAQDMALFETCAAGLFRYLDTLKA